MIILIAQFEFPTASRNRVLEIVRRMDSATANEDGRVFYKHAIDVDNDCRLILAEIWSSAASLAAHFCSSHFRAFHAITRELGVQSKVVQFSGDEMSSANVHYWKRLLREGSISSSS